MATIRAKRSLPSLVGGIFTAIVVFALWLLLFGISNILIDAAGALVALTIGIWIRLADL